MSSCKKCNEGTLEHIEDHCFGETEIWACDKCDVTVVVPVTIERHFDDVDWSCADDKQE
jgi:ribosomal protein L37AE/L43A